MQGLCAEKKAIGPESHSIATRYSRSLTKNPRIVIRRACALFRGRAPRAGARLSRQSHRPHDQREPRSPVLRVFASRSRRENARAPRRRRALRSAHGSRRRFVAASRPGAEGGPDFSVLTLGRCLPALARSDRARHRYRAKPHRSRSDTEMHRSSIRRRQSSSPC